eukprot:4886962-Karenia_brevis.AAC.1
MSSSISKQWEKGEWVWRPNTPWKKGKGNGNKKSKQKTSHAKEKDMEVKERSRSRSRTPPQSVTFE